MGHAGLPHSLHRTYFWFMVQSCKEARAKTHGKTVRWYLDKQEWMDNVTSGEYMKYYEDIYTGR